MKVETMKVRATAPGFYLVQRIKPGQVFHLFERPNKKKNKTGKVTTTGMLSCQDQFSENWMEKVDDKAQSEAPKEEKKAKKSSKKEETPL